jgi:uncharacterized protein YgbK (DUF1537 family)
MAVAEPVDRVLVLSGSCSPVSGRQIKWSLEHGFYDVRLDMEALRGAESSNDAIGNLSDRIVSALRLRRSAIVHSCCGPEDPRLVIQTRSVRRVAVFGGDTSGHIAESLGIEALEYVSPLEPGAPLCRVHSRDEAVDGLEIVFKGGQVGYDDFLATVLHGNSDHPT